MKKQELPEHKKYPIFVGVRISRSTYNALQRLAKNSKRSLSAVVRSSLDIYAELLGGKK